MNAVAMLVSLALAQPTDPLEAPLPPLWRDGRTLGDKVELEQARVCADAQGRVVAIDSVGALYYGDERTLTAVYSDRAMVFDPRQQNEKASASFEESESVCLVACGTRLVKLPLLPEAKASALLVAAKYAAGPHQRAPHALLRDDRGVYYYVDRGRAEGQEQSFRLFVGPKGAMVLQKMTNVVADSAGEIFSTKTGDLRLLIDKEKTSEWIQNGKRTRLRMVPVGENLHLIYADLGVYAGQRLGTPCDDL